MMQATPQTGWKLQGSPCHRVSSGLTRGPRPSSLAEGFTLLEMVIAVAILMVVVTGITALFGSAFSQNRWQGDASTRTIEYAQDKMESLLMLLYTDNLTDTTVWPYCNLNVYLPGTTTSACLPTANGTGLGVGGNTGPAAVSNPPAGHFDYLTAAGDIQTSPTNASYIRVWQIQENAAGNLKTITVEAASINGSSGLPVTATLQCLKTKPK